MNDNERTRDLFEQISSYPKPPLVPLPEPGDLGSLEAVGLKPGRISRGIVKAAMFATGFWTFQKRQLPQVVEGLLRQINLRGPFLFAPVVSATLALQDDARNVSAIERAATLLFAVRSLYDDVMSGQLAPDQYRGQVLEMGQYPNFFSTSVILDGNRARVFKSTNVSRIIVVIAGRFYSLDVGHLGSETTMGQLKQALTELVRVAQQDPLKADEPAVGVLTCATDATQRRIFRELEKIETNVVSLSALRHSFLTLCLDLDSDPASCAEAALIAHSGNCANRWYHSSLQIVVFGNAKACAICNFSAYLDGNTMMRGAAEIQKRAAVCPVENGTRNDFVSLPPATKLTWQVSQDFIQRAHKDLRSILDDQQATFEIQDTGKNFFAAHNLPAVPVFILALQMMARRLTGQMAEITQFLTMSKYRCYGLVTAMVTTPEVVRFVDYMGGSQVQHDQAMALMQEAIDSQARVARQARRYLPLNEIFTLFFGSRKGIKRSYIGFITALTVAFLRALGLFKPGPREIVVSHPDIYPQIPLVGRPGIRLLYTKYFGLHYQIMDDRIVITMMPSVDWTIPNADLIAELQNSLRQIQLIVGESAKE